MRQWRWQGGRFANHVVVVDAIGDPKKIGTKEARVTEDPRNLMMAENCARIMAATPKPGRGSWIVRISLVSSRLGVWERRQDVQRLRHNKNRWPTRI